MKVNHFLILLACMTVAISLGGSLLPTTYAAEKRENIPAIGMPNPWVAHKDMQTAEQAVGFPFRVPKTIGDMMPVKIETLDNDIIQVFYREEAEDETCVLLRKGYGDQDVSGNYCSYGESTVKMVGSYQVTMQGDDGCVMLATWTKNQFSYSLSAPAMTMEEAETVILAMK